MADISGNESPSGDMSAQEKARLRRERRAAKIAAGGASRLKAITELQGGTHRDVEKDVPVKPTPSPRPHGTATPDPDVVDISEHHYSPAVTQRPSSSQPNPFAFAGADTPPMPSFPNQQGSDASQDPMLAMLQQMMGANAGASAGGTGQPDLPPGLANLLSTMQGGGVGAQPSPAQSSAWIWRLVHSLMSLVLSVYMVVQTPFDGSKRARNNPAPLEDDWTIDSSPADAFKHFFYLFATFEVVLQSSRYFIEKGQLQGSGMLSSIAQFLPEPYSGYVRVIGRYSVIYRTVVNDAMVVVFVLGALSWWRGGVAL